MTTKVEYKMSSTAGSKPRSCYKMGQPPSHSLPRNIVVKNWFFCSWYWTLAEVLK